MENVNFNIPYSLTSNKTTSLISSNKLNKLNLKEKLM